jgi:AP-5 complex subunit sigma-1
MVYAVIIHVIAGDSARIVYQRYFCQENTAELQSDHCLCKERTVNLHGIRVPTPTHPVPQGQSLTTATQSPSHAATGPTAASSYKIEHDQFCERWSCSASPAAVPDHESAIPNSKPKELIIKQRQQSQNVADYVQSEYLFRKAVTGRTMEEDISRLNNEDTLPEFEMGFLRLPTGEPYQTEKISLWQAAANCCFTFVLERHENRSVAENVLKRLIGFFQEHFRVLNQPSEAMLKVDRVDLILDKYLPGGQLLFMNNKYSRQLEKQIEQIMKS